MQDRDGAKARCWGGSRAGRCGWGVIWADGAYAAVRVWVRESLGWVRTTVLRPLGVKGYVHLPRRWIVERTFGWFGRYRRLSKDYEHNPLSSETRIYIAMIHRLSRRLLPEGKVTPQIRKGEAKTKILDPL